MNGKDIFLGLKYVGEDLIEEAEYGSFSSHAETKEKQQSKRLFRRPLLVAAIIAMMLLLVGCAVVYVLNIQGLKMGEEQRIYDAFSDDGLQYIGKETVTEQVLTLAGINGTPAYQAAQEWFDFRKEYDPDGSIQADVWGNVPDFGEEYDGYGLYTQEMKGKLDEIVAKYGLKLQGKPVRFQTDKLLFKALGMENVLNPNSRAEMKITWSQYYENGNLDMMFEIGIPGEEGTEPEETWGVLYYRRKECLIPDTAEIHSGDWKEWNYTTASGDDVLIIRSPSSWVAWIFCDMGDCTASLRVEAKHEYYSDDSVEVEEMTDRQLELLADAIDFSIEPKLIEGYENMDDGAVTVGEEIDGYRIDLKSAFTDGYAAQVVLGITAPEGVDLTEPYEHRPAISPGNWGRGLFTPVTELDGVSGSRSGGQCSEDGDGKLNTCEYVLRMDCTGNDGVMPFQEGSVWKMYWEDINYEYYDLDAQESHETVLAEGAWDFNVTFEDGDYREIELLSTPITAKACIGWKLDGTDVFDELEVTSIKLRSLSIELTCENKSADFFCFTGQFSYIVMKDGSMVEFISNDFNEPIDLDQVDHVLLADGTKLTVPTE